MYVRLCWVCRGAAGVEYVGLHAFWVYGSVQDVVHVFYWKQNDAKGKNCMKKKKVQLDYAFFVLAVRHLLIVACNCNIFTFSFTENDSFSRKGEKIGSDWGKRWQSKCSFLVH